MNPTIPYILQRQSLRLRLQAQRLLISRILATDDDGYPAHADGYPRSVTMRVLTRMPSLASFLITDVAPYLVARFLGSVAHDKAGR